ncbi:MAG: formyltetrahydrofolate deformylase [Planctomycetota bacterium]|jgi:formyltetrahydrofolate deformylase
MATNTARLLISCPDQEGLIALVAGFIASHGGNILEADQHSDPDHRQFFMRVEIDQDGFHLDRDSFAAAWEPLAREHDMRWWMYWGRQVKRMAILVSKESHCLSDLLWRWSTGELNVEIPFVAGNHAHLAERVGRYEVPFHHVPITPDTKAAQEGRLQELLAENNVDFIVLARFMQILTPEFVANYPERIINIHHSFLPAFAGPKPYHQAYDRGVKIIGATSHYVTDDLDEGPIIAQSTLAVGHRDTLQDLIRKGRDLERIVLATAVRHHVQDNILVSRNRTVVFD